MSKEKRIQKYREALIKTAEDTLEKYLNTVNAGAKHLKANEVTAIIAVSVAIGTAIGSAVPGPGNAVGASVGAVVGATIAGIVEATHLPENLKYNNAIKVSNYLNKDLITKIVDKIINNIGDKLEKIKATKNNLTTIAGYLGPKMFAAIKEHGPRHVNDSLEQKATLIANNIENTHSKKAHSSELITEDEEIVTTKSLLR